MGVGVGVGTGVGAIVGDGEAAGPGGSGPGQAARRNAKIAARPGSNPRLPRRVSAHERRYLVCQAIAVNTIQIPLRTIIGIAGIGFFFAA